VGHERGQASEEGDSDDSDDLTRGLSLLPLGERLRGTEGKNQELRAAAALYNMKGGWVFSN
jgi:hypothetical protein